MRAVGEGKGIQGEIKIRKWENEKSNKRMRRMKTMRNEGKVEAEYELGGRERHNK
jgi:hypothetical protein